MCLWRNYIFVLGKYCVSFQIKSHFCFPCSLYLLPFKKNMLLHSDPKLVQPPLQGYRSLIKLGCQPALVQVHQVKPPVLSQAPSLKI